MAASGSEYHSSNLAPNCRWGDLWSFCLFHRRNVGHEVDVLQPGDLGLVDNLVTEVENDVDWDVNIWKPQSVRR